MFRIIQVYLKLMSFRF